LHGLTPPLVHNGFKTSNVLVDENFIAKVADAGIGTLLRRIGGAGSSQAVAAHLFQDPEYAYFLNYFLSRWYYRIIGFWKYITFTSICPKKNQLLSLLQTPLWVHDAICIKQIHIYVRHYVYYKISSIHKCIYTHMHTRPNTRVPVSSLQ